MWPLLYNRAELDLRFTKYSKFFTLQNASLSNAKIACVNYLHIVPVCTDNNFLGTFWKNNKREVESNLSNPRTFGGWTEKTTSRWSDRWKFCKKAQIFSGVWLQWEGMTFLDCFKRYVSDFLKLFNSIQFKNALFHQFLS